MLKSLNSKIYILIGLTIVILFGFFSYIFLTHQKDVHIENSFKEASMISEIITKATKFNMPLGNRNCILRIMNIIGTQDSISYVRMVNDKGITAFSSEKGDIGKSVLKSNESCNICHIPGNNVINMDHAQSFRIYHSNGDDVLGVMTPIYNSPNCYSTSECHVHSRETKKLGILDVRMSLSGVRKELKRSFFTFTIFLFLVLLCFIIVTAILISRFVTSPVKQMVAGTKKVADGDLNVDIKVRSKDEIGQLAISFNLMIIDLKIAHEEIRNWSMRLEKKIEERTRKLYLTRAKLIQSEKMASLGVLASSVAHEINNPLQGILTYIKLMLKILKGGKPTDKNLKDFDEYLVLMGNEIERCGGMVKNLLVFSKQSKLEIREEDINSIIDNALKLVENKVKLQNIHILTELGKTLPKLSCDRKQIQQSFIALLINSIEAIESGGEITIKTAQFDHEYILISISDTGKGISEVNIRNVFDPFYTTKESSKNTGLGLFVVYGIIKEHNGTIEVKSKPGEGTKFLIKLPILNQGETGEMNEG